MVETPPLYLEYYEHLRRLDRRRALSLVDAYLEHTADIDGLYADVLMPAMVHAGREWEQDRISVAHEHYISEVTRDLIQKLSARTWVAVEGPVAVACCAPGERHVIGLMMVCDILRSAGFVVHLLGEGAPVEDVRDFVLEVRAHLLCLSCGLGSHLAEASALIAAARQARPELQILVGGRAFESDPQRARAIGADHFARDVREARKLLSGILRELP